MTPNTNNVRRIANGGYDDISAALGQAQQVVDQARAATDQALDELDQDLAAWLNALPGMIQAALGNPTITNEELTRLFNQVETVETVADEASRTTDRTMRQRLRDFLSRNNGPAPVAPPAQPATRAARAAATPQPGVTTTPAPAAPAAATPPPPAQPAPNAYTPPTGFNQEAWDGVRREVADNTATGTRHNGEITAIAAHLGGGRDQEGNLHLADSHNNDTEHHNFDPMGAGVVALITYIVMIFVFDVGVGTTFSKALLWSVPVAIVFGLVAGLISAGDDRNNR